MPSIKLSVNVNKVATLRNSRGGREPDVLQSVDVCVAAGAPGITVHPRADERHIRMSDVYGIAERLKGTPEVEFNIEGDPRPELLELVLKVRPTQCTLVPVQPGEITSQAGWPADTAVDQLQVGRERHQEDRCPSQHVHRPCSRGGEMGGRGGRRPRRAVHRAVCARIRERAGVKASFKTYAEAAELAHSLGLGINAGHDLDLQEPPAFPPASAPRGSLHRPCAHESCAVCRARALRARLSRCAAVTPGLRRHDHGLQEHEGRGPAAFVSSRFSFVVRHSCARGARAARHVSRRRRRDADRRVLRAFTASRSPGIVLLHMLRRSHTDWDAAASQLSDAGFAVLALDYRNGDDIGAYADRCESGESISARAARGGPQHHRHRRRVDWRKPRGARCRGRSGRAFDRAAFARDRLQGAAHRSGDEEVRRAGPRCSPAARRIRIRRGRSAI